jgi:hypothetical protein
MLKLEDGLDGSCCKLHMVPLFYSSSLGFGFGSTLKAPKPSTRRPRQHSMVDDP